MAAVGYGAPGAAVAPERGEVEVFGSDKTPLLLFPLAPQIKDQALGQHPLVRFGQVGADDFVVVDVDTLKDGLVQVSPKRLWCTEVVRLRVSKQSAEIVELGEECLFIREGTLDGTFSYGALGRNPRLLALQMI